MYQIFYDITENKIRSKVAKILEQEGYERLQYSVYMAHFNPQKNKVWIKLQHLLKMTPHNKIYCLKITRDNFYNIKTIGKFDLDLTYLAGEKSSLII